MIRNGKAIALVVVGTVLWCVPLPVVKAQNAADNLVREFYAWYPCVTPASAYHTARLNPQLPLMILVSARPERDRFAAFSCIVGARVPGYKTIVVQALRDPSERIRATAVHCLPEALEEDALVKQLIRLLDSPSSQVRHNSLEVLRRIPSDAALEKLFELAEDESGDIRHMSVFGILSRHDEAARVRLRKLCRSPNIGVAGTAAAGLAQVPSEPFEFQAVEAYLRQELTQAQCTHCVHLIYVLGLRGGKESMAVLEAAKKHENPRVQQGAAQAISQVQIRQGNEFDKFLN